MLQTQPNPAPKVQKIRNRDSPCCKWNHPTQADESFPELIKQNAICASSVSEFGMC